MVEAFIKGITIGLILIFAVGPVIFSIIKQSVTHGRRGGFSFVVGVWLSDVLWVIFSNAFSEVIKIIMNFKTPIGIAGSAFLIGMGIYFLFFKTIKPRLLIEPSRIAGDVISDNGNQTNYFAIFTSGFLINTLNPGLIAFWIAMAISLATEYTITQRIVIFSTCLAFNMLADIAKVLAAGSLGNKLSDKNILLINKISGLLYLSFGLVVFGGILYSLFKH